MVATIDCNVQRYASPLGGVFTQSLFCGSFGRDPRASLSTACCADATAEILTVTTSSTCACADGHEIVLVYSGVGSSWDGTGGACGATMALSLYCDAGTWKLDVNLTIPGGSPVGCNHSATVTVTAGFSCDPLDLEFTDNWAADCCDPVAGGAFDVTFTVTE